MIAIVVGILLIVSSCKNLKKYIGIKPIISLFRSVIMTMQPTISSTTSTFASKAAVVCAGVSVISAAVIAIIAIVTTTTTTIISTIITG